MTHILDRITDYKIVLYTAYARAGVDIVHMGDDLGTQSSLIMSPGSTAAGTSRDTG